MEGESPTLTFSWIELQLLLRRCIISINIIIMRRFLYLVYLCLCLDLDLFMSNLSLFISYLFFVFVFIFIIINHIISLKQINLLFLHIFYNNMSYYFWTITCEENEWFSNSECSGSEWCLFLLHLLPISAWFCL